MHVINLMLSASGGGLEQSAVDYACMLRHRHHQVTSIVSSKCVYINDVKRYSSKTYLLENKGVWDMLAARRLKRMLRASKAQAVICHGNRAFTMARKARLKHVPIIVVTHNTKIKPLAKADAVFAITHDMHQHVTRQRIKAGALYYVPNMARIPMQPAPFRFFQSPIHIVTLGRLSHEKGIDILLDAIAALKADKDVPDIRITIGGEGPERKTLEKQVRSLGLESCVTFAGWIDERDVFLRQADIFCYPSRRETFGIALAEAMGAGIPCVATDCSGPSELIPSRAEGIITGKNDPAALAEALTMTIRMSELDIKKQQEAAFLSVSRHNISNVSAALDQALESILK